MNPPFYPPNMSKEDFQSKLNSMNPEMMKNASRMMSSMTDDQIQSYLNQMGMSGINPQMFKNMCQSIC